VLVMSLLLLPSLRRVGFTWRWTLDLEDAGFRRIGRLAGWAFVYVAVNQIGYASVIILASKTKGGYTAFTSAFQFFQLPYAIFAVSIMTALLPALSSHWSERDPEAFRRLLARGVRGTAFIVVPATFGYLALSTPMIRLLLQHGVMQPSSTRLLSRVLIFFSIGLFPFCAFQLLLRAFYAMQDTRTPALINVGENLIFIAGNLILVRYLSVGGLALSNGIGYTFASVVALLILRRRLRGLDGRRLSVVLGRILVAGVAAGGTAYAVSRVVASSLGPTGLGSELAQVLGAAAAGLAVFLALALLFRLEELEMIKRVVLARARGGRA